MTNSGTGKTYASAFAMREPGFQRVLFLVHRNQIARQAMKSYQNVFDQRLSMGLVMGSENDYNADYIFATIQTVSKDQNLQKFGKYAFDSIILVEAHHSVAGSYKKVLDYFEPKLWLGMTATPDKRDDNKEQIENFRYLVSDDRIRYVMEQAEYYGYSGNRVKGLIFSEGVDVPEINQ